MLQGVNEEINKTVSDKPQYKWDWQLQFITI